MKTIHYSILKPLALLILLSHMLFSATDEQVERYLSVTSSEEQLLTMESQFSQMQQIFDSIKDEETSSSNEYDMQLLSIRFREYLKKNLSEDEMDEILKTYRSVVLLKYVSVQNDEEYDEKEAKAYMKTLQSEENATVRIELLEKISNTLYNKENLGILFDNLMKPLLKNGIGGQEISDEQMKKTKETYIKAKIESGKLETIYMAREFTMEELEALLKIVKTPAIERESKVVYGATAYALQEFFLSLASRYDVKKHQR